MVQCSSPATSAIAAQLDLDALNEKFETASPQAVMRWALRTFPHSLAQTNAFSIPVTIHMLYEELQPERPVPVVFINTLHHFPETLETLERARQCYDLDLHIYQAQGANSRETFADRYGDELWRHDIERFHYLTKVEPLERALQDIEVKAWITGRRRDQSEFRQEMPIIEVDSDGRLKINPLANWTRKDLWRYVFEHDVVYNPLHDRGYTSIGDEPLTTPVQPGEHERAGRWRGSEKTECGIHV